MNFYYQDSSYYELENRSKEIQKLDKGTPGISCQLERTPPATFQFFISFFTIYKITNLISCILWNDITHD